MEPMTVIIISGSLFILFFVLTLINFAYLGRKVFSFDESPSDTFKTFGRGFASHVVLGGLASLFFFATLLSLLWLVVTKLP